MKSLDKVNVQNYTHRCYFPNSLFLTRFVTLWYFLCEFYTYTKKKSNELLSSKSTDIRTLDLLSWPLLRAFITSQKSILNLKGEFMQCFFQYTYRYNICFFACKYFHLMGWSLYLRILYLSYIESSCFWIIS